MPRSPFAQTGRRTIPHLEGVALLAVALIIGAGSAGWAETPCPPRADGTRPPAFICNGSIPPLPRPRQAQPVDPSSSDEVSLDSPVVRPTPLAALKELPLPRPRPQTMESVGVLPFPVVPMPRPAPGEPLSVKVAGDSRPLPIFTPQPLPLGQPQSKPGAVLGTRTGLIAQIGRWASDPVHTGSIEGAVDTAAPAPVAAPVTDDQVQKAIDGIQAAAVARAAQSLSAPNIGPIETDKDPAAEKSVTEKPADEATTQLADQTRPAKPVAGAPPVDNLPLPGDSTTTEFKSTEPDKSGDRKVEEAKKAEEGKGGEGKGNTSKPDNVDDTNRLRAAAGRPSGLYLTIRKDLPTLGLSEVVGRAVSTHPEIGQARARASETRYGIRNSRSALHPQVDASIATGQGTIGQYDHLHQPFDNGSSIGSGRIDAQLQVRQRLFDFGAARADIMRSTALHDAERWKLLDKIEDIALRTSSAYLKILEMRELLVVANENVTELEHFARIVDDNQRNGNGTIADVKRVQSRLVDAQTMRTDIESQMEQAIDQFRRLVGLEPGQLISPPQFKSLIPADIMKALNLAPNQSTALLAASANVEAVKRELDTQRALGKPRVNLELASSVKNYMGVANRSELDMRGMVVFSHKLYDGGAQSSQIAQTGARLEESQMKYIAERDNVEADLRQYYRAISASRRKLDNLREGVQASKKVKELYTQQFQAGKRTLFEVLDSQMQYYTAQRDRIVNQYEELRGIYGILRTLSRLSETILAASSPRRSK